MLFGNFSSFDRILYFIQVTYQNKAMCREISSFNKMAFHNQDESLFRFFLFSSSFFWFINRRACVCETWLLFVWKLLLLSNRKLKQFYRISHALPNRLDTSNSFTEFCVSAVADKINANRCKIECKPSCYRLTIGFALSNIHIVIAHIWKMVDSVKHAQ